MGHLNKTFTSVVFDPKTVAVLWFNIVPGLDFIFFCFGVW